MATTDRRNADSAVEAAVVCVLQAEQRSRAAVESARAEAASLAEEARNLARVCSERARARVARSQKRVQQRLQGALAAIEAEARTLPEHDEPDAAARARLEAAVQTLAAALTGGRPEGR